MNVAVLPIDREEIIDKLYTACRTCYNSGSPIEMFENIDDIDEAKKLKLLKHVLDSKHMSVLEHVSITVIIEGVSRALTHQLVRHRVASYSQASQRYITFKDGAFDYVTPPSIKDINGAPVLYESAMKYLTTVYDQLIKFGVPAEDARMVLPNACCSNITMTVNLRELIHQCNERLCTCAQWEIRALFREIVNQVVKSYGLDFLKPYLQPKCVRDGYCSESAQRTCGRMRLRGEVINGEGDKLPRMEGEAEKQTTPS